MQQKILIIDDEVDIRVLLRYNLEKEGYQVIEAEDGKSGIEVAIKEHPDLILLDVMMPGMDGVETCEKLREKRVLEDSIVCMLTARGEDYSQLAGFNAGADDYITKPVKPKILLSKIAAMLRRHGKLKNHDKQAVGNEESPSTSNIEINLDSYTVFKNGEELSLPRKEFELLALLMENAGKVCKRDEIMTRVWGTDVIVGDRTIDVHIRKLRKKIGDDVIQTIKGVGYKFIQ
ncbi:MAG: response regulator transcription factor [Crocinitomicaceae bacterium]|nr:response regulator transcription factor [Crocinitomicaceae bacterium]